ncbi:hypothetical protein [Arenicella xantha]|uniref:Uncharacterized protein n=1 Tax=Arenicella xantha TaxID=644221 RepID=A0A395JN35_9GAMM|nr:hypothetical protein [Arenicella xantha]RBP53060.1 hypothetical protein DFR28_101445 [Arenicella xantha]
MKNLMIVLSTLVAIALVSFKPANAQVDFNLLASTPSGSWQLREDTETDAKGRQTGSSIRTSMLEREVRDGKAYYWIEVAMDSYKISKKGKRKPQGDRAIIKTLIPESTLKADPANVLNNLRGFGVETIVQSGNEAPMRMGDTDGMMAGVMKAFNTEIEFDFESLGNESVTVPAGDFSAQKIRGQGSVSMKVMFKKINVESDNTSWLSTKVPFGTVKVDGTTTTNGKESRYESQLVEFGMNGAKSEITAEPKDMPEMPKLGDLFGG